MNLNHTNKELKKRCPVCHNEFMTASPSCPKDGNMLMVIREEVGIGTVLNDQYELLSELGRGGMSIVYKGKHLYDNKVVAIKVLHSELMSEAQATQRFLLEGKAISSMSHKNLVKVYNLGVSQTDQMFIVMECLEGKSLTDVINTEGNLDAFRVVNIFIQVCEALELAHHNGIIHRDLKSSNIMLLKTEENDELVKVVDFGIAKLLPAAGRPALSLTQTGEVFGSPIYMSPEQCLGVSVDFRSDIYALGVVMYEALIGEPPLFGHTVVETMHMHVSNTPPSFKQVNPNINVPEILEKIVFTALNKKPAERFQSMQELKNALIKLKGLNESALVTVSQGPIIKSKNNLFDESEDVNAIHSQDDKDKVTNNKTITIIESTKKSKTNKSHTISKTNQIIQSKNQPKQSLSNIKAKTKNAISIPKIIGIVLVFLGLIILIITGLNLLK